AGRYLVPLDLAGRVPARRRLPDAVLPTGALVRSSVHRRRDRRRCRQPAVLVGPARWGFGVRTRRCDAVDRAGRTLAAPVRPGTGARRQSTGLTPVRLPLRIGARGRSGPFLAAVPVVGAAEGAPRHPTGAPTRVGGLARWLCG